MKKTLGRIVLTTIAAAMLSLNVNAYTIPEYSFDYEQYMGDCEHCDLCYNGFYTDDAPNNGCSINIILKCEYSYFNSVWTIEDFPELKDLGIEFEHIVNHENWGEWTDEEIEAKVSSRYGFYHTLIDIYIAEEYQSLENAEKVKNAIMEAYENGRHPEFISVDYTIYLQEDEVGLFALADINGDSEINSVDATMIVRHALGVSGLDSVQQEWADVNQDGTVNSIDATMVVRYALGVIDKFGNVIE